MRHAFPVLSALTLAIVAAVFTVAAQAEDDVTQTICDAGNYACLVQVDADGAETTVCGDVVWEPDQAEGRPAAAIDTRASL